MKNYLILLLCACTLILIITTTTGCNKDRKQKPIDANNEVFTQELHDKIVEIHYCQGGEKLVVDKQKGIDAIFNSFASLKLVEMSSEEPMKVGHLSIDIITKDGKKEIGLLSGELATDSKRYSIDKDIIDETRKIALKYDKK